MEEKNPQPAEKEKPGTPAALPAVLPAPLPVPVPLPPSPAVSECPPENFAGQNRVAQWTDPPSQAPAHAVASGSNGKPRANGHVA